MLQIRVSCMHACIVYEIFYIVGTFHYPTYEKYHKVRFIKSIKSETISEKNVYTLI